jgi:hypothetical protein
MKKWILLIALAFSFNANAFRGEDQTGLNIGSFSKIKCGLNTDCDAVSGNSFQMVEMKVVSVTADSTLAKDDCGSLQIGLADVSITLPDAGSVFGCRYSFLNGNDASSLYVNPQADDNLEFITNAAGDGVLSNSLGDSLTIVAVSVDQWMVIGVSSLTEWVDADEN